MLEGQDRTAVRTSLERTQSGVPTRGFDMTLLKGLLLGSAACLTGTMLAPSARAADLPAAQAAPIEYVRVCDAYGAGFWVNNDPGFYGELGSEGAYGWGSAYYPQYLIDPKEKLVAIFLTQLRPAGGVDLVSKFKVLTYQAIVK